MGRLKRFPSNRFVGRRDHMVVYDCDDDVQFGVLAAASGLYELNLLQSFAPDVLSEARNRGFRPYPAEPEGS